MFPATLFGSNWESLNVSLVVKESELCVKKNVNLRKFSVTEEKEPEASGEHVDGLKCQDGGDDAQRDAPRAATNSDEAGGSTQEGKQQEASESLGGAKSSEADGVALKAEVGELEKNDQETTFRGAVVGVEGRDGDREVGAQISVLEAKQIDSQLMPEYQVAAVAVEHHFGNDDTSLDARTTFGEATSPTVQANKEVSGDGVSVDAKISTGSLSGAKLELDFQQDISVPQVNIMTGEFSADEECSIQAKIGFGAASIGIGAEGGAAIGGESPSGLNLSGTVDLFGGIDLGIGIECRTIEPTASPAAESSESEANTAEAPTRSDPLAEIEQMLDDDVKSDPLGEVERLLEKTAESRQPKDGLVWWE